MTTKPLCCPCCGADGWLVERNYPEPHQETLHRIECIGCGLQTPHSVSDDAAIAIWNRRPENLESKVVRDILHGTLDAVKEMEEVKIRHRCSTCLRDFSTAGSCVVHIGNYHSKGGVGEYDPRSHAIPQYPHD